MRRGGLLLALWVALHGSVLASAGSSLGPAVSAIESGTADVKTAAAAIVVLLSALLAIALVVMLYMRAGGGGK